MGFSMFSNQTSITIMMFLTTLRLKLTSSEMGIKVLSYFVGDSYGSDGYMKDFKRMYGSDEFINLKNVTQISKLWTRNSEKN